jgi:hypothetical protein
MWKLGLRPLQFTEKEYINRIFLAVYETEILAPHCKEPIPKIMNKYSQKRNCAAKVPNFHIHVSVSDLYIPAMDLPILLQEIWGSIPWEYVNCSQTHECVNLDLGHTIPRKGKHKWDFPCNETEILNSVLYILAPHCKESIRKNLKQIFPEKEFPHSCVCGRFMYSYSHNGSAYSAAGNMWTDPGNI